MLRVIGGAWKGRRLHLPRGGDVRPTSAKVREALFDIIDVADATFLDLFAGTGAVGIEALSRGAGRAVFVERDRRVLDLLRQNIETIGAGDRAEVVAGDAAAWRPAAPFEIVFADPPYHPAGYAAALAAAVRASAPGADVVLERAARDAYPDDDLLDPVRTYRYGDTVLERRRRRG